LERYSAGSRPVGPGTAAAHVGARAAIEEVVALPTVQEVPSDAPEETVVAHPTEEPVVGDLASEEVVT
jgi:hypothetical protein